MLFTSFVKRVPKDKVHKGSFLILWNLKIWMEEKYMLLAGLEIYFFQTGKFSQVPVFSTSQFGFWLAFNRNLIISCCHFIYLITVNSACNDIQGTVEIISLHPNIVTSNIEKFQNFSCFGKFVRNLLCPNIVLLTVICAYTVRQHQRYDK